MKLSEIKKGKAYAYNPYNKHLGVDGTERVVVVRVPVVFTCRTWRGEVTYRGARIRFGNGKTTNVEIRRLLATWSGCLKYRAERAAKVKAEQDQRRRHTALCQRLQKYLRNLTGVPVVVDHGWSNDGFEIHMHDSEDEEGIEPSEIARRASDLVEGVAECSR